LSTYNFILVVKNQEISIEFRRLKKLVKFFKITHRGQRFSMYRYGVAVSIRFILQK